MSSVKTDHPVKSEEMNGHAPFVILDAGEKLLTKTFYVDMEDLVAKKNYDKASKFKILPHVAGSLREFSQTLIKEVVGNRHRAIANGSVPHDYVDLEALNVRRKNEGHEDGLPPTLKEAPTHLLALDVDKMEIDEGLDPKEDPRGVAEHVARRLEQDMHVGLAEADFVYGYTSSAGLPSADEKNRVSVRLFFWMEQALTNVQVKAWLNSVESDVEFDTSIYHAAGQHAPPSPTGVSPTTT